MNAYMTIRVTSVKQPLWNSCAAESRAHCCRTKLTPKLRIRQEGYTKQDVKEIETVADPAIALFTQDKQLQASIWMLIPFCLHATQESACVPI